MGQSPGRLGLFGQESARHLTLIPLTPELRAVGVVLRDIGIVTGQFSIVLFHLHHTVELLLLLKDAASHRHCRTNRIVLLLLCSSRICSACLCRLFRDTASIWWLLVRLRVETFQVGFLRLARHDLELKDVVMLDLLSILLLALVL